MLLEVFEKYRDEVLKLEFPTGEYCYGMPEEVHIKLLDLVRKDAE